MTIGFLLANSFRADLGGIPDAQREALLSVRECHVQAGRKHKLVLFFPCGRVGDVGVAKIILPSEPLADLRDRAQTEVRPVVAPTVRQVWEKREILQ